jgi:PAS domain S-box-containing protein
MAGDGSHPDRLRTDEAPYAAFLDGQPEMVCRFRIDGTIIFVNGAYARARDSAPERMVGRNFWDFVAEADRASVRTMLQRLTPEAPEIHIENRFRTAAGERWILWANRALKFDAHGLLLEAQSSGIDITERKRAEDALAISARRMAALYQLTDRMQHAGLVGEIYEFALDSLVQALGCDRAAILLLDPAGVMRFVAWRGLSQPYRHAVEGCSTWLSGEPEPTRPFGFADFAQAELPQELRAALAAEGIRAAAFVPLMNDAQMVGRFVVYYDAPHPFLEDELDIALTIGNQVAFGLQRFRVESERRDAEKRLRVSEQELSDFFETAAIGLHWVGPDGTILRANQAELDMLGYAREEYVGRHIAEFYVDRGLIDDVLACLHRRETVRDRVAQMRHKDGSIRDVLLNSSVLFENGEFIHTRCFTLDITERTRSEQALVESERSLRLVSDNVPALISYIDRDHRYRFVNARYREWLGVDQDSLSGIHMRDMLGEEMYEGRLPYIERVFKGETVHFENVTPHLAYGYRATDVGYVPHIGRDGVVQGFYVLGFDITERKRTEEILRKRARQQHAVAELGKVALREPDLQRVFDHATLAVAETLEIEFCKLLEILPGEEGLLLRSGVGWKPGLVGQLRIAAGIESQAGYALLSEHPVVVADLREEERFHDKNLLLDHGVVSGMTCLITGAEAAPWGVIGAHATRKVEFSEDDLSFLAAVANTLSDAILRHRAEEALKETDRRKDEFLATLSHELRNPLAPLKNSLHLLRMLSNPDTRTRAVHEMMERQVGHLVRLVDDLLEMSRISRGVLELRPERVDLSAIVRNAIETSQPLIERAGHRLDLTLPQRTLWLDGDPVRLAQILSNLLNNSAKYTPAGGRICVHAWKEADGVVIAVKDNGMGIAPEALPRIFEMFSRGEHTGEPGDSSLGIGLPLARRLAEMHGGSIEARSEGRGLGAEFLLRLPLAAEQQPGTAGERHEEAAAAKKRVLVVDDNRDAANSLGMLLEAMGAQVSVVHSGPDALDAFARFAPSLVLLDIGMPEMDGYEVARRIRGSFPEPRALLVALTGWGQEEDRRRASAAGFDHHLTKPADIEDLQRLLASQDSVEENAEVATQHRMSIASRRHERNT